ncbi:InlB B-repeat-containing protein, partial [Mesotoga sp. UBA5557]|uniref:InlB B-repeat-containing protein n=1 Tax=Mesotoga sp. UBA5557 TaxID=1946857 RepID=UPI0039C964ED
MKTFEVTVTAEPKEGGEVMGADIYDCGEEATVTAVADECYDFDGWFVGET